MIRASSPSAAARAFSYYLSTWCLWSYSPGGSRPRLPAILPRPRTTVRLQANSRERYFLNYCTFNYSMSWYDWRDWESTLDWMAMLGVNLSLAVEGTEKVWQTVLSDFGVPEREILEFLPGPAYTAWWLMGNLEGWGGPVSRQYIENRAQLQCKIIERMRELGIRPVMQGFWGMVPTSLKRRFPGHAFVPQGTWGSFTRPDLLLPSDSLFSRMAQDFYATMDRLYGPADFYAGDPFHEGGNTSGIDVASSAGMIQREMRGAHPEATWVLQGWQGNPRDELLRGVEKDHILVLDLNAESAPQWQKRNGFHGSPWLWCAINNFGDNTAMHGKLDSLALGPVRARRSPQGNTLRGVGFAMEGFDNDPVNFDLLFASAWGGGRIDVPEWLTSYCHARYGRRIPAAEDAWRLLYRTVYSEPAPADPIVCARPSTHVDRVVTWSSSRIRIDNEQLGKAAGSLLRCAPLLTGREEFKHDLVNTCRQYISNKAHPLYEQCMAAYRAHDARAFKRLSSLFLDLMADLDTLLSCRKEFLLGTWLEAARRLGRETGESDLFELNARELITVWGDSAASVELHDYSYRQWAGMLSGFYAPRWKIFFDDLGNDLEGVKRLPSNFSSWEANWSRSKDRFPSVPTGDAVQTSARLLKKYMEMTY